MKIFKKLVGLIVALSICLSASAMTASARRTQLMGLSDEEIKESVWEDVLTHLGIENSNGTFEVSFTYYYLNEFLKTLEIPNLDYDSMDASEDFEEYMNTKYSESIPYRPYSQKVVQYIKENPQNKLDWELRGESDGKNQYIVRYKGELVDEFNFENDKYFSLEADTSNILLWSYDDQSDNWVCKDESGKIINTIKAYHLDDETSNTTTSSKPTEQSSTVSTTSNPGGTVSAEPQPDYPGSTPAMPDSPGSSPVDEPASESPDSNTEVSSSPADVPATDSTVSDSPATEEAVADQTVSAEEVEPNNNNAMQTVLIIIGILIIAGIIVIIVMLNKRKREDNNGK